MRRNREEEEQGNAREEGRVRTKTAPSSFALSPKRFVFCISLLVPTEAFSPQKKGGQHKKIVEKTAQAPKKRKFLRPSFASKPNGAPKREKKKEREGSSSLRSQPHLSSFPFKTAPRASSKPASLSLLRRANPVGSRWIPRCTFCSTGSKRKRSKGNFGSRSLLRG